MILFAKISDNFRIGCEVGEVVIKIFLIILNLNH
jgi:hypothetical protein